jgi:hypothetical protein
MCGKNSFPETDFIIGPDNDPGKKWQQIYPSLLSNILKTSLNFPLIHKPGIFGDQ